MNTPTRRLEDSNRGDVKDLSSSVAADLSELNLKRSVGSTLRFAREHHQLSLREVERRIGRSNAYLSQVERGLIKKPDPMVLLELSEIYGLDFIVLAKLAQWEVEEEDAVEEEAETTTTVLIRQIMELDATQKTRVIRLVDSLLRESRT